MPDQGELKVNVNMGVALLPVSEELIFLLLALTSSLVTQVRFINKPKTVQKNVKKIITYIR